MTDSTPPLHPLEHEQLQAESTIVVTVETPEEFHDDVTAAIDGLAAGDTSTSPPTLSFASYDDMLATLTPRVLDLIETIRQEEPDSINDTARVVDRDVKNVHEELSRLARLGMIFFAEHGQSKAPVVWFDELVISLPFESGADERAAVPS